jgi:hypothetical protein
MVGSLRPLAVPFRAESAGQEHLGGIGYRRDAPASGRNLADLNPRLAGGTAIWKEREPLPRDPCCLVQAACANEGAGGHWVR